MFHLETRSERLFVLGVLALVIAILSHAAVPRYEWLDSPAGLVRIDRWTGAADRGVWRGGAWVRTP